MITTTETGNVSQQPECLGEKGAAFPPFVVVVDAGIPYEEEAATVDAVREVLKHVHQRHVIEEDDIPHLDVVIIDDIDRDVTDMEPFSIMFAAIVTEYQGGGQAPSPEGGEECSHDPMSLAGKSIGMYHCPDCGEMVVAGLPHPKREPEVSEGEISPQCTYGDAEATKRCAACGKPLCPSCGFRFKGEDLCNGCFELDPR